MMQVDFKKQVDRLFIAFHKKPDPSWENLLFEKCKYWKGSRLAQTVDKLIETTDKFPSLAEIYALSWTFAKEEGKKPVAHNCDYCAGSGGFSARHEGRNAFFRCHACLNWKAKYGEAIPQWSDSWHNLGYMPDFRRSDKTSTEPNTELARDSREFIETVYSWRGSLKEKAQFEIAWATQMAEKYPHLASEFKHHQVEARIRLETLSMEDRGKDAEKEKSASE